MRIIIYIRNCCKDNGALVGPHSVRLWNWRFLLARVLEVKCPEMAVERERALDRYSCPDAVT